MKAFAEGDTMAEPVAATEERIKVREVTGVAHSRDALETAVGALLESGFDRADVDIMAGTDAIAEKLGGIYAPIEELADVPQAPRRFFRAREDVTVPLAGAAGILTYIGATAAALGVVASGGALAAAVAAAAAGGAAAGGIGALVARSLGQEEARELEHQIALGGVVLWVRVRSPEEEQKAQQILSEHGAEAVRVHEIEVDKRFEGSPLDGVVLDPWLGDEPLGERS
jgi:hypothetical protein